MKRLGLKPLTLLSLAAMLLASCNGSSDGAPATTMSTPAPSIAAPTTASPSITAATTVPPTPAPTTVLTTTAPPASSAPATTIGDSPEEVARAEVIETLNAFWTDVDACFAAPDSCDKEAVINTYTNADSSNEIVDWFSGWIDGLRTDKEWFAKLDEIERTLIDLQFKSAVEAFTMECKVDRSARVRGTGAETTVLDGGTGFGYYNLFWTQEGGRWIITTSNFGPITPGTANPCDF